MERNQRLIEGGYVLFARAYLEMLADLPVLDRALWMWLLCKANHRDCDNGLRRGQLVTTTKQMAEAMRYVSGCAFSKPSPQAIRRSLRRLCERNMAESRKTTRGLVVTICHYDRYQRAASYGSTMADRMADAMEVRKAAHDKQELKKVKKKEEGVLASAFSSKSFYQMDCDKADAALAESAERFLNDGQE
jgi:hypothetical protein